MRSDYVAVFDVGGADALNRLLRERCRDPTILDSELRRMERGKLWKVEWDEDADEGRVVARLPQPRPAGS